MRSDVKKKCECACPEYCPENLGLYIPNPFCARPRPVILRTACAVDMNGLHETHFSTISSRRPQAIFARARTRISKIESASEAVAPSANAREWMGAVNISNLKSFSETKERRRKRAICIDCISHETKETQSVHFI